MNLSLINLIFFRHFLSYFNLFCSYFYCINHFSGRYEQLLANANQANVQQRLILLPWGFRAWFVESEPVSSSESNQDVANLSVLRGLLLPIREALQKGRGTFNANNNIEGPMTWRYFKTVEIQNKQNYIYFSFFHSFCLHYEA